LGVILDPAKDVKLASKLGQSLLQLLEGLFH
jgi:hypothetical protein